MGHISLPTGLTGQAFLTGRGDQIRPRLAECTPAARCSMPASLCRPDRRQLVDPTTCERDYDSAEIEFMQAVEQYKRTTGRRFPTCSEMLAILRSLGYVRVLPATDCGTEPALSAGQPTA